MGVLKLHPLNTVGQGLVFEGTGFFGSKIVATERVYINYTITLIAAVNLSDSTVRKHSICHFQLPWDSRTQRKRRKMTTKRLRASESECATQRCTFILERGVFQRGLGFLNRQVKDAAGVERLLRAWTVTFRTIRTLGFRKVVRTLCIFGACYNFWVWSRFSYVRTTHSTRTRRTW